MPASFQFCFDYASPFSYFAQSQLAGLLERTGAEVEYRPVLLGGIFKSTGNKAPMQEECVPKRNYTARMIQHWVAHYGVPFQFNPHFPVNTIHVMRTCVAAQKEGVFDAFHAAIFPAMWVDGRNLGEPTEIAKVCGGAGLDGERLVQLSQDPAVKDTLRANTDAAVAAGAFGVPTFLVGDELFWGADHMHFVERALKA